MVELLLPCLISIDTTDSPWIALRIIGVAVYPLNEWLLNDDHIVKDITQNRGGYVRDGDNPGLTLNRDDAVVENPVEDQ
jgi:hypothetical protein